VLRDLSALRWFISPGKSKLQQDIMNAFLGLGFCSLSERHVGVQQTKQDRAQVLFWGVLN
jgi:hypothetical protein